MATTPPPAPARATGAPVAIVTGANSGIGLAVSVALVRAGHVVYAGMRDAASADELLAAVAALAVGDDDGGGGGGGGGGVGDSVGDGGGSGSGSGGPGTLRVLRMDVGNDDSVAAAVATLLSETDDRVDVAVANAGYGAIANVEAPGAGALVRDVMDVNFFGALRLVTAVVPSMRRRRAGRVVGVSSVAGLVGHPFYGPYAASKFAIEGLWESCYAEYKALGVHFILVEPGPVKTNVAIRAKVIRAVPPEVAPALDAFMSSTMKEMVASAQSADACAAYFMRAVTDPDPALRYMTHPASEGMLRSKYVDVDGAGVAATTLGMVAGGSKRPTATAPPPPATADEGST